LLLSACHDKMPMLRDGTTGNWIGTFQGHKGAVWSCQMDGTGNLAATASGDYSARVWDAVTGQCLVELPHGHIVKTCTFSPDSTKLVTGGKEAILRVYDLPPLLFSSSSSSSKKGNSTTAPPPPAGGQHGPTIVTTSPPPPILQIPQEAAITKCVWLSNTLLLCACMNGKIYLWDTTTATGPQQQPIHTFDTKTNAECRDVEVRTLERSSNDNHSHKTVMTVAVGNKVCFFDVSSSYELLKEYTMPIHFHDEGGATLHPLGNKFVAGGSDLWVRVFDYSTGLELECHKGHHGPIRCVRYSPDGHVYASGSEDGTIRLWMTDPTTITSLSDTATPTTTTTTASG
jgi:serine-threonine kinase receptor-associated protein